MKSRKDLKAEYKQLKPLMGVFQVTNKANGKILIEGSTDITAKWNRHSTELRFASHRNTQLQKDWNTYGADNFEFKILSELEVEEGSSLNLKKEVELLKDLVLEEENIQLESRY